MFFKNMSIFVLVDIWIIYISFNKFKNIEILKTIL